LPDEVAAIESWSYQPIDSASAIAAEVERRWLRRRQMLPGLEPRVADRT